MLKKATIWCWRNWPQWQHWIWLHSSEIGFNDVYRSLFACYNHVGSSRSICCMWNCNVKTWHYLMLKKAKIWG